MWHYCKACGGALESRDIPDGRRLVCIRCGRVEYRNPCPYVQVHAGSGTASDFVSAAEHPDQTAERLARTLVPRPVRWETPPSVEAGTLEDLDLLVLTYRAASD